MGGFPPGRSRLLRVVLRRPTVLHNHLRRRRRTMALRGSSQQQNLQLCLRRLRAGQGRLGLESTGRGLDRLGMGFALFQAGRQGHASLGLFPRLFSWRTNPDDDCRLVARPKEDATSLVHGHFGLHAPHRLLRQRVDVLRDEVC